MRMQRVTDYLFSVFKLILVYFPHTFHCLINEAAYHTNLVLLTICFINNTLYGDVLFRRKTFPKKWGKSGIMVGFTNGNGPI